MSETLADPYRTPDAPLNRAHDNRDILRFKRFTAWGVLGLSIITLGIYPVYWMVTRAQVINLFHEDRISPVLLYLLVIATVFSMATFFLGASETEVIISGVITLVYFTFYLIVLFKIRNRLQEIVNHTSDQRYKINIVLTFFFYTIYLQYKINECIDDLKTGA